MMEVEETPHGWVVRLGPFQDEAEARRRALIAEVSEPIATAISAGESYLRELQGHYTVRVDGGPGKTPVVEFGSGATLRVRCATATEPARTQR
jgi:hypothetical protein